MERGIQGTLIKQSTASEPFRAYIPNPLPPSPTISWDNTLLAMKERASVALGRLDGIGQLLPDLQLVLYFYVRKEAVLSSQIEGTQSSLSDLLLYESKQVPGVPIDDVQEVSSYVAALNHGVRRVKEGFPISTRLVKEIHKVLLRHGRGAHKEPGEFRRTQNWIGGTRPGNAIYVPPPAASIADCMSSLERYIHSEDDRDSTLTKAALIHVQFETIHPFLDGNGRVGRLLIPLLLLTEGILSTPLLYLSLYFKKHRQTYYELLQEVRFKGQWERWLAFFFEAVERTSEQAVSTANKIVRTTKRDRSKIEANERRTQSTLRVYELLQHKAFLTIPRTAKQLGLSQPTVTKALMQLQSLGIVTESSGRSWNRLFAYDSYIRILEQEIIE